MKKFVLHCNRCTFVTWFFNLNFDRVQKEGTLGTRLISETFSLSESATFSTSD